MLAVGTGDGPPDLEAASGWPNAWPPSTPPWACIRTMRARRARRRSSACANCSRIPKVVAVGEIGLDYHYDFSPREVQREVFARQVEIAARGGQAGRHPHPRGWDGHPARCCEHWAARRGHHPLLLRGTGGSAARCSTWAFYLSFAGVVTFPKAVRSGRPRGWCRRPPAGRDRRAVSGARPASRQAQRAGLRRRTARRLAEMRGEIAGARSRHHHRATFERLCLRLRGSDRVNW